MTGKNFAVGKKLPFIDLLNERSEISCLYPVLLPASDAAPTC